MKEINPKVSVYLFSKKQPQGEMFNLIGGKDSEEYKSMLDGEWFDTPSKLNLPKENKTGVTLKQAEDADPMQLIKLIESMGFIVMTQDQMKAEALKMASVALDITKFGDKELMDEAEKRGFIEPEEGTEIDPELQDADALMMKAFKENPKSLTTPELVIFGNKLYSLGLRSNMKEDTLITKIQEAMNA